MQLLRANTEIKVRVGSFVDPADGLTPKTGITLAAADEAELLKNNGAATVDLSGATWAAVANCDGWYDLTLTAGHTDTEGLLTVVVQDDSACLPVFTHFMVLSQAAFDSMFAAKDAGYMDVNVKAVSEDTVAADNLEAACDGGAYNIGGGAVVAASVTAGVALGDGAITSAKYDEATAFPLTSVDAGETAVARAGADGDTLETLSDEIAANGEAIETLADAVADISMESGPGDYAVTLTIRTVGGVPLAGVNVWANTTNTRSVSLVKPALTDDNGQVTFYLNYTTYHVFCHLAGYTFAAASFTASAGSVAFTKDIATAVTSGSAAFYTDSFLSRSIAVVRENLDEPSVNAKYTDARIVEHLEQAYILVLNEKNRNSKTPAVVKQAIALVPGVTKYALPHVMGSFYGLYRGDEAGGKIFYDGRSRFNPYGQRVWLEGNTLNIQSVESFGAATDLVAEWIPSGIARLHNGVCTVSVGGNAVTLAAAPNVGVVDTHASAYAGSVIRILGVDGTTTEGNYLQERNIVAYDNETRQATLDVALDPVPATDDGYIYYEIAPAIHKGMDTVVALYAAYRIMAIEGNQKRAGGILAAYRDAVRNVRLTAYYSNMPEAPLLRGDNYDNRRYRRW